MTAEPAGAATTADAGEAPVSPAPIPSPPASRAARAPRWELPALAVIVGVAAVGFLWHLDQQGWANPYYAAAAQSGAGGWRAFLFGSIDPGNAMATDKPPLALWVMAASVRLFGLNSWSLLAPQALMTLGAAVLLQRTVRRQVAGRAGALAGLIAAAVLVSTPAVVVLARFDDPDTALMLLAIVCAYALTRALQGGSRRWLVLAGVALGLAFLAKALMALLIAPALTAALWVGLGGSRRQRLHALLLAGGAAAVSAGWWVALVALTPPGQRPYLDASVGNSVFELVLGRNGVGRLVSNARRGPAPIEGYPGPLRLVQGEFGGQIGWLLPLAVVMAAGLGILLLRQRRWREWMGEAQFATWVLWTTWLLGVGVVLSLMEGALHPYYSSLLAPGIAALVGVAGVRLAPVVWRGRWRWLAVVVLAMTVLIGLPRLATMPDVSPWLPAGLVVIVVLVAVAALLSRRAGRGTRLAGVVAVLFSVGMLAGPASWSTATLVHPVTGSDPSAGPALPVRASTANDPIVAFLRAQPQTTWVAAVPRATAATPLQLASGRGVLALGGYSGRVTAPTRSQVQAWARAGRLHYVILAGPYRGHPGSVQLRGTQSAAVVEWARHAGVRVHIPGSSIEAYDVLGR